MITQRHEQLLGKPHWLRHTTLTWVERTYGYGVARAYAGHATASTNRFGVTATYIKGDLRDVATALAALTGEPHPLALASPESFIEIAGPDHHAHTGLDERRDSQVDGSAA